MSWRRRDPGHQQPTMILAQLTQEISVPERLELYE